MDSLGSNVRITWFGGFPSIYNNMILFIFESKKDWGKDKLDWLVLQAALIPQRQSYWQRLEFLHLYIHLVAHLKETKLK